MSVLLWMIVLLLVAESAAALAGWHGLALFGRHGLILTLPLLVGALVLLSARPMHGVAALLGGGLGLLLFVALAAWRQRERVPERLMSPGERAGRRFTHTAIPLAEGQLPAVVVEPRAGSDCAVLLLHGAGDHKTHFLWPLLHGLADAGLAVCSVDVDGHGENPRPLDFPDVLEDVVAGVAWLRARYRRVAVLGISQGGCIAARAVVDGTAVDALVVLEAPITVAVTRAVIRREALILAHPAAWSLLREVGTIGLWRHWPTAPTRARIGTVALIERLDIIGSVRRIGCPLLLCYGGSDAVVPRAQARAVAAAAPPGATFLLIPRATHLSLSIDRRVIRRIAHWLRAALN